MRNSTVAPVASSSPKLEGHFKMKNLIPAIMLIAIGAVISTDAFAKIDSATLEKQRKENKARLEKTQELRTGMPKKRLFSKSDVEANKLRSLKLDAIPASPRRSTKNPSTNSELALPANPRRITSTAKLEYSQEEIKTARE